MADRRLRAVNCTRGVVLVAEGRVAATLWERFRGLLGRKSLARGDGLLLKGEQAIHTIGMQFPIDALFLDRRGRVVRIEHSIPPLRLTPFIFKAANVLELPAGMARETNTQVGDALEIEISNL